jgi:hypothetical protein
MADADNRVALLLEVAESQQQSAQDSLAHLRAHTLGLDAVVRDEIRRTLVDELRQLSADGERAAQALRRLGHAAAGRMALWGLGMTALCTTIAIAMLHFTLPTPAQIAALRAQREQLQQAVATLTERGGGLDLRRCGAAGRLCVRVDRRAPVYGASADYYLVRGR